MDAEATRSSPEGGPGAGLANMFNDPQMLQKLAANPKTSPLLADPSFMAKLQRLRQNPNSLGDELRDPRFLQVMSVLLGIDMSFGAPGDGPTEEPNFGTSKEHEEDTPMPDVRPSSKGPAAKPETPEPALESEPEDEEEINNRKLREEAEAQKKLGTEKYKQRDFDAAIEHYGKAWELYKDITYLTNKSAAKFEKGDYQGAIDDCKVAVEEGREMLADFKIIAKYNS